VKRIELHTDGACSGNPGRGGWAAILVYGRHERALSGSEPTTTNNRMELMAVIEGLRALKEPCQVTIYSDSQYVVNAFAKGWIADWQRRDWRKKNGDLVVNPDLWQQLLAEVAGHEIEWQWVEGHTGNPYNERCDRLRLQPANDDRAGERVAFRDLCSFSCPYSTRWQRQDGVLRSRS
jgi:ribonuclease HI